jgi:phenylalanyl-tRNA synthetase alpha chain
MWVPDNFNDNYFYDIVRDAGNNLVEEVSLGETFVHPKTLKTSKFFHISYRSLDRTLTGEEIDEIQKEIKQKAIESGCEIR